MPIAQPTTLARLPPVARCDFCLCRFAVWWVEQDGTRLCDRCVEQYMKEHGLVVGVVP
ncbi:MAG: hypothetical protein ACP5EK_06320 [Thermoplasmatota archaeon]